MNYKSSIEYDLNHSEFGLALQYKYTIKDEFYRSDISHLYLIEDEEKSVLLLKVIRLSDSVQFDVKTAMKLDHKGIAKIIEYGYSDNFLYLVKEYVEGVDLEKHVIEKGKFLNTDAEIIIKKIANVLEYLHTFEGHSIVYRDLKPSNIILTPKNEIVLIDIITLRTVKEGNSTDTFYIGSRGFSAPEQYGFSQSTEASDIYALGATLYYLLTSKVPDNNKPMKEQLGKVGNINDTFSHVILKAMQFNPGSRYKTVNKMLQDLIKNFTLIKKLRVVFVLGFILTVIAMGWMYKQAQFDVEAIETPEDIVVEEIIEITSGLAFKLSKGNIMNITFDREEMQESLKDFKFMTVGTSINRYHYSNLEKDVFYGLTEGFGFQEYFRSGYNSVLDNRNNLYLAIYGDDKRPLGYYIYNNIALNLPENLIFYDSPEDVLLDEIQEIESGIEFELRNDNSMLTSLDKNIMSGDIKNFEYMSVWTSKEPYSLDTIQDEIYNSVVNGNGMFVYSSDGYTSNIEGRSNLLVTVYAQNKMPLGYYIYNDFRSKEDVMVNDIIIKLEEDIEIETFESFASINVFTENVPEFTKIAIWGTLGDLDDSMMDWMRARVSEGDGVADYDFEFGYGTGYGTGDSFSGQSWMLFLLDDEFNIIKEYIIYKE